MLPFWCSPPVGGCCRLRGRFHLDHVGGDDDFFIVPQLGRKGGNLFGFGEGILAFGDTNRDQRGERGHKLVKVAIVRGRFLAFRVDIVKQVFQKAVRIPAVECSSVRQLVIRTNATICVDLT